LQELGKSLPEVEAEVSRLLGKQLEEIRRLFTQAAEVGYNFDIDRLHPDAVLFAEKHKYTADGVRRGRAG